MKYFDPKEYRANRNFMRKVRSKKLFTFFVSNVTDLKPFDRNKRPWIKTYKQTGGFDEYVTTAVIDFILPDGRVCRIPKGFLWDGASIPKFAQGVIGRPMGDYALAGLIHDWLYCSRILGNNDNGRKKSDELFLLTMKCLDISWWRRKIMYRAVRIGGHSAYFDSDERHHCKSIFSRVSKYNPWSDYKEYFPENK